MKKTFVKLITKPALLLTVSLLISIVLLVTAVSAVLLPRYNSWQDLIKNNEEATEKLENINASISFLSSVDKDQITLYRDLIEKLSPQEEDPLRAVSIIDKIAEKANLTIKTFTVTSKGTAASGQTINVGQTSQGQTTTPGSSGTSGTGDTTSTTTPTTTSPNTSTVKNDSYKINAVLKGQLSSILKILGLLGSIRRSVGVTEVSIATEKDPNLLEGTISFTLPLSGAAATASPQERIELSSEETQGLQDLLSQLTIDASPTSLPLGRPDPFR